MGRKRVCVGCSHFFCGGSVSAINNVSSYKDARLKSTKASSGKKTKKKTRSGEDTSNTRGASPSVDHPFPIYLQRNTNNANIFYEAPSCFAALSQSKCPCCSSKKDGGGGGVGQCMSCTESKPTHFFSTPSAPVKNTQTLADVIFKAGLQTQGMFEILKCTQ